MKGVEDGAGLTFLSEQVRAYNAGDKYYVELDIIMGEEEMLKVRHDVCEALQ